MLTHRVLILTPVKDAGRHLGRYFELLSLLTYPHELIDIGMLESDSRDSTWADTVQGLQCLPDFGERNCWQRPFGLHLQGHRWSSPVQIKRRAVLARSRNNLLAHALRPHHRWVLWIDVDVIDYPADIIEQMMPYGSLVNAHCVTERGGSTFDQNAWKLDIARGRELCMDQMRGNDYVHLDAVGGTMLLVWAALHRDGLMFPPFLYGADSKHARPVNPMAQDRAKGEIETEGMGVMAWDMGVAPVGLPHLEVVHYPG